MPDKIMSILAGATGGKSYKAHKYGLDYADRPFIDYGEDCKLNSQQLFRIALQRMRKRSLKILVRHVSKNN